MISKSWISKKKTTQLFGQKLYLEPG